jgi:glycerol transport system substrate-binding protein
MDEDGTPKWKMAPSPHGVYWEEGMKVGYQDVGSWTLMKSTPVERAKAAWLYAQFVTSKTVDLKKSDVGLTFIRESTIQSDHFTERAPRLGGLIEFYRSPARTAWSPTGTNVPDYPKLAQLWWQNIGDALSGAKTEKAALDALCEQQERVMSRLERAGIMGDLGPELNEERDPEYWLSQPGAPKPKLADESGDPITMSYEDVIKSWN